MTTANKKLGFDGQWIDGTPVGRHIDSDGDEVAIDLAFLEAVSARGKRFRKANAYPSTIASGGEK